MFAGDPIPLKPEGDSPAKFHLRLGEKDVWGVAGEVDLPTEIPLGNTGLALYRFEGGIAHNMGAPDGSFNDVMQLIQKPGSDSWLFMGGCRVCVKDNRNLFHADGTLTIGLPDFTFGIDGDAWFFTDSEEKPGQVQVNVLMDPTVPLFKVSAGLDLGIPDKWIVDINGNMELQMAPGDTHLAIGWPYPDNAVQASVLGGMINPRCGAYFTPTSGSIRWGESWNYWVFSGNIDAGLDYDFLNQPYFHGGIWASGCVDFYIASLGASAGLEGRLYDDRLAFNGVFRATIGTPWPLPDIHLSFDFSGDMKP